MALGPQLIIDLLSLKRLNLIPDKAEIIEIGAQQLSNLFFEPKEELSLIFELFGRQYESKNYKTSSTAISSNGFSLLEDDAPSSRIFWEALGFSYSSIDYDGHRDSIALDLNRDDVPLEMRSKFDIVINSGTTEHIANQDHAFRVIHELVKPGGLMIHDVPAGGMVTHGVIGYNMQFFFMLCRENGYKVLDLGLVYCGDMPIHPDIIASNASFARMPSHKDTRYAVPLDTKLEVPIFMIRAVLQKNNNAHYVTPLDIPESLKLKIKKNNSVQSMIARYEKPKNQINTAYYLLKKRLMNLLRPSN